MKRICPNCGHDVNLAAHREACPTPPIPADETFLQRLARVQPMAPTGHVAFDPPAAFRIDGDDLVVWVDGVRLRAPLSAVTVEQYPSPMFSHGPLVP